jgi:anti-sigma B factor antagonist
MVQPEKLEIGERAEGADLVLSVEGELDLSTIPRLAQHIDGRIGSVGASLLLDLSGVTFMDSSGLRLLIELHHRAQREGWKLSLTAPAHEAAQLVLRITGADAALPFTEGPR